MPKYIMIDVGSPCDSISLRTLVETLKHQEVEVHDAITGEVFALAMWAKEEQDGEQREATGVQNPSHGLAQSGA